MEDMIMKTILINALVGIMLVATVGMSIGQNITNEYTHNHSCVTQYDLLCIAPKVFSKHLQPFINHKNAVGIKTLLETMEEISASYDGRDPAEQLKYAIKDAKEQYNISYVLLVGGLKPLGFGWYVPVRYAQLNDGSGYTEFLTDLYFADLYKENGTFDDWDSNGNGVFGEWGAGGDVLDLTPDVAIGRLPCRTTKEVDTIVQKIITYENQTGGASWFHTMVAIGGDSFPAYSGYEGEETCDIAASYMTNFTIKKLYTSTGALTGPDDIIQAINQGCGFLMTRGKGGTERIRMGLPEGAEIVAFQNKDVSQLKNTKEYPICVLGECIHARFDICMMNLLKVMRNISGYSTYDCVYECIAWRLIRERNAGAIAVLTNTNICYGAVGDANSNGIPDDAETYGGFLAVELFRLYSQGGITTLGMLYQQALINYVNQFPVHVNIVHSKSVQEFILFGDPSLQIGGYP